VGKSLIRSTLLVIAPLAVAGALAGCGGGGEAAAGTTVTTSSHSKAEFIKLASAICDRDRASLSPELERYMQQHGGAAKTKSEALAEAIQAIFIPKAEAQVDEIRAIGAPRGDEQQVERFLVATEEAVAAAREARSPTESQLGEYFKRSAALASEYGLDHCAY
jgi:hypothetical protein